MNGSWSRVGFWLWGGVLPLTLVAKLAGAVPLTAERADRLRIQRHLAAVEERLRSSPPAGLSAAARERREELLDELGRYWRAGVFPTNTAHPGERRPYFIDDAERACAVGQLIVHSGYGALAARIDRQFHNEYVPQMRDAELLRWADQHGFTVAELALIQPTYCNCDGNDGGFGGAGDGAESFQPVCGADGLTYWNACIAELCGDVPVVAAGACEAASPRCELCGVGARDVVVSECTEDVPTGICSGIDTQPGVAPVPEVVAKRWLELQASGCERADYEGIENDVAWGPSWPVRETWECTSEGEGGAPGAAGGAGGSGDAGAEAAAPATSADTGCTVAGGTRSAGAVAALLAAALILARRRFARRTPEA